MLSFFMTGPFKINGVPLRRVNQSYVIATSTKVDISGVNVEKFDDKYFAKEVAEKKKKGEGEFFEAEKEVSFILHILASVLKYVVSDLLLCCFDTSIGLGSVQQTSYTNVERSLRKRIMIVFVIFLKSIS